MDVDQKRDLDVVADALKSNRFDPVIVVDKADDAKKIVLDMIPPDAIFAVGGSTTVSQLGLTEQVMRGTARSADYATNYGLPIDGKMMPRPDVLVASSNAVTLDGKLVNTDGTGNRVSSMIFGPKKVILVIGVNKIVRNVEEALDRIRNVIAPYHAREIGRKTPCAKTLRCTDCNAPDRICNVTTIIEKKPSMTDTAIILVGEDMGLGWSPDWDETRKEKILSVYRQQIELMRRARGG